MKTQKTNVAHVIKLLLRYSPSAAGLYALITIVSAIISVLQIYTIAWFIDSIQQYLYNRSDIHVLFLPCAAFLLLILCEWMFPILRQLLGGYLKNGIMQGVHTELTEARAALQYCHVEDEAAQDVVNIVSDKPENRIFEACDVVTNCIGLFIRTVGVLIALFMRMWWIAILIPLFSVPLLKIAVKGGKQNFAVYRELAKVRRKAELLKQLLIGREAVGERTVFSYSDSLNDEWCKEQAYALDKQMAAKRKWYIQSKGRGMITTFVALIILALLLYALSVQLITVGFFVAIFTKFMGLISNITWQLPYYLQVLTSFQEYTKSFEEFYKLSRDESALVTPMGSPAFTSLELVDVTFRYPGTDRIVLDHVSFCMKPGKHYALVGVNGAGKTTLIKILAGLYDNYTGKILLNGKDIKSYSPQTRKAFFSFVFQDFARYFISLKDNILIGDMGNFKSNEQNGQLELAIDHAGLVELAASLPKGLETRLGKIVEDSVDLSGGEWQRVALARGEIRHAPIIVMDEPTAALDPISESQQYLNFSQTHKEQAVLFISHRLGSIRMADSIILLDGGRIKSIGSHDELMENSSLYRELYEKQRSLYK